MSMFNNNSATDKTVSDTLAQASSAIKDKLNGAVDSVEDTVKSVYPEIQSWANKADKTLHDGVDNLLHASEKAQASAKHYAHSVESYVSKKPIQSALIAAAAGAAFAALIFNSRRK